jgi:hypothetical protein
MFSSCLAPALYAGVLLFIAGFFSLPRRAKPQRKVQNEKKRLLIPLFHVIPQIIRESRA